MSKQDGYASRTAADLERKYNFGQTFAEVYGLVRETQRVAEEAKDAYEGLDQEQIFNLLTNFGENEGIYRDDKGDVYVNASYIKGGKLLATNVEVEAASISGTLDATKVNAKELEVSAAKVVGKLTSAEIEANQISGGTLDFAKVTAKNLTIDDLGSISFSDLSDADEIMEELGGGLDEDEVTTLITSTLVSAPIIQGGEFKDIDGRVVLTMDDATWNGTYGMLLRYSDREVFGVWCSRDNTAVSINGNNVLSSDGSMTYAIGVWDFSDATVIGL